MGLQDDLLTLAIKIENGTASAAEIEVVKNAVDDLGKKSEEVSSSFAKPVEHVGLHLLSHELTGAIGLTGQARNAFILLNAAMKALGLEGAAALGPMVLALGAAALAFEHFGKGQEQSAEKMAETLQGLRDNTQATDEYAAAGGRLSRAIQALKEQQEQEAKALTDKMAAATAAKVAEEQATIATDKSLVALHQREEAQLGADGSTKSWVKALEAAQKALKEDTALLEAQQHGYATVKEYLDAGIKSLENHKKAQEDAAKASEQLAEQQRTAARAADEEQKEVQSAADKMKDAQESLAEKTKILEDEKAAATQNAQQKRQAEIQKFQDESDKTVRAYQKQIDAAREYGLDTAQLEENLKNYKIQVNDVVVQRTKQNYSEIEIAARNTGHAIESAIGDSLAKSIVEGKNFEQEMKNASKRIAEQVISDLVRIAIQAAVTKAAVGGIFGSSSAAGGVAGGASGASVANLA